MTEIGPIADVTALHQHEIPQSIAGHVRQASAAGAKREIGKAVEVTDARHWLGILPARALFVPVEEEIFATGVDEVHHAVAVDIHQAGVGVGQGQVRALAKNHGLGPEPTLAVGLESQLQGLVHGEQVHASVAVEVGECHVLASQAHGRGYAIDGGRAFEPAVTAVAPEQHAPTRAQQQVGQTVAGHVRQLRRGVVERRRRQQRLGFVHPPIPEIRTGIGKRQWRETRAFAVHIGCKSQPHQHRGAVVPLRVGEGEGAHQGRSQTVAVELEGTGAQGCHAQETGPAVPQQVRPELIVDAQAEDAVTHLLQIEPIPVAAVAVADAVAGLIEHFIQIPGEHPAPSVLPAGLTLPEQHGATITGADAPAIGVVLNMPELAIRLQAVTIAAHRHQNLGVADGKGVVARVARDAPVGATFDTHDVQPPAEAERPVTGAG